MKRLVCSALLVFALALELSLTSSVAFAGTSTNCTGGTYGSVTVNCPQEQEVKTSDVSYSKAVTTVISYAMYVVGALSVIIIIMGGIMYATAAGDEAKTAKAKKTIVGAIIGLVFAILASAIVAFVKTQIG